MSKSNLVAFRVPADLQDVFNQAVEAAGGDKSSWLVDAIRQKLNRPESNPDNRMMALVERMEIAAAALVGGKQDIPPHPYNQAAVVEIVAQTISEGLDNGRIIAERINAAGYQTKAGKSWDKDIYSAWKRQGNNASLIPLAIGVSKPLP
ncbi:hypothetical protein A8A01_24135 [Ewingella americana]|nr:hypothetical protein A8A01_24135 [Ewingella americana]